MNCLKCDNQLDRYAYTRQGLICPQCVATAKWFVPDFAWGQIGITQSIIELTDGMVVDARAELIFGLYLG